MGFSNTANNFFFSIEPDGDDVAPFIPLTNVLPIRLIMQSFRAMDRFEVVYCCSLIPTTVMLSMGKILTLKIIWCKFFFLLNSYSKDLQILVTFLNLQYTVPQCIV